MPFNCREFAVAYSRCLSLRIVSIAATSLADVPVPVKRRIGGTGLPAGGAQAVGTSEMKHTRTATEQNHGTSRVKRLAGTSVIDAIAFMMVIELLTTPVAFDPGPGAAIPDACSLPREIVKLNVAG
jgi:hypothetical protein